MVAAITVNCTHCDTAFPVDPAKVPPGGVNARCSECEGVFFVDLSGPAGSGSGEGPAAGVGVGNDPLPGSEASGPGGEVAEPPTPPSPDVQAEAGADVGGDGGGAGLRTENDFFAAPGAGTEGPPGAEAGGPGGPGGGDEGPGAGAAGGAATEAPRPKFGQRTPEEKAKRLARVLVSDMISYNPDLHRQALARGTLKEDFEEEIEKSWDEYVEQVGEDLATSTSYWKDALNEVLAEGEEVF